MSSCGQCGDLTGLIYACLPNIIIEAFVVQSSNMGLELQHIVTH